MARRCCLKFDRFKRHPPRAMSLHEFFKRHHRDGPRPKKKKGTRKGPREKRVLNTRLGSANFNVFSRPPPGPQVSQLFGDLAPKCSIWGAPWRPEWRPESPKRRPRAVVRAFTRPSQVLEPTSSRDRSWNAPGTILERISMKCHSFGYRFWPSFFKNQQKNWQKTKANQRRPQN